MSPSRSTYAGLFLVTLATVMYEVLLTRIFSVTTWYHLAFVAVSIAMFGMTVGALAVYLRPGLFPDQGLGDRLAGASLAFGVTIVLSFLTHLAIPFSLEPTIVGLWGALLTYAAIAVPFALSGIAVTLALTRFPQQVGRLYAADLLGAAAGCLVVIAALDGSDGPTAVVASAGVACLGAAAFAGGGSRRSLQATALLGVTACSCFVALNALRIHQGAPLIRLTWVKGAPEPPPLYEKWNSFSRITVTGDPAAPTFPSGWGFSGAYAAERPIRQLMLRIDAAAGTVLTGFSGRPEEVEHLRWDVTNVAHYLRRDARVLVIGVGGGRDVLSALAFGQRAVVGVELNQDIVGVVNQRFGDFTGHLDRRPGVTFVVDEARSQLARRRDAFDIVQMSVIDTWAATGAGAFVLSEHSLYTVEAWRLFLERLTPRGLLAVSRHYAGRRPDEMYRLTALASAALIQHGSPRPREHLAIVRAGGRGDAVGVATLLASPTPLAASDVDALEAVARQLGFELVLSPRHAADDVFAALSSGRDPAQVAEAFPANIAPPTDDSPFFFHTLRFRDTFAALALRDVSADAANTRAIAVVGVLLATVLLLSALCILGPLALTADRDSLRGSLPLFVFFAGIGLGFMLVEISQMQRLMIFLGHPTYGLSVVLVALLGSGGIGSALSERPGRPGARLLPAPLAGLLLALVVFGLATPAATRGFAGATTPMRVAVAVAMLFPPGLFMGMAFPLGMRLAGSRAQALAPWLWGINGAASVCASVLAVIVALGAGITAAFWTGVASYAAATAAFVVAERARRARAAADPPER